MKVDGDDKLHQFSMQRPFTPSAPSCFYPRNQEIGYTNPPVCMTSAPSAAGISGWWGEITGATRVKVARSPRCCLLKVRASCLQHLSPNMDISRRWVGACMHACTQRGHLWLRYAFRVSHVLMPGRDLAAPVRLVESLLTLLMQCEFVMSCCYKLRFLVWVG